MNRPARALIAAALMGLSVSFASACHPPEQDGPAQAPAKGAAVDPAAKEFIEKFRAIVKKVDDISCTVTQTMTTGEEKTSHTGNILATLTRRGNGGGSLKLFKISSRHDGVDGVWAFDGKTASKIDNAAKTFASMEAEEGVAFPVQDVQMVVPTWVYGTDVLSSKDATLTAARFLPDATADGVSCKAIEYSVEVVYPAQPGEDEDDAKDAKKAEPVKMTMRQVRLVGAEDLIPRSIESHVRFTGGAEDLPPPRTFVASYTNVKVNTKPGAAAFALKAPEGFKTVEAEASDLGIPSDEQPKLKFVAGDAAPAFALKTPDGTEVTLASLKGKIVLLDFWATWCGPCKMAMPGVQKLHEKFKDKGVAVYGVDTFEHGSGEKARKYMADKKYTYGLLYSGDELAKAYGISGIPTFVLIGKDGKILHLGVGFDEGMDENLSAIIEKALAGK
ncbi:MAG TPA: redoxin family protein [Phycisphaerales bacterium]|nr:redoxin family protein [Phycisphaerales bacterium]